MKTFRDFLTEQDDERKQREKLSRDSLLTMIANSLNKLNTHKNADLKSVMMLIAALSLLNASDSSGIAVATARRLAASKYK